MQRQTAVVIANTLVFFSLTDTHTCARIRHGILTTAQLAYELCALYACCEASVAPAVPTTIFLLRLPVFGREKEKERSDVSHPLLSLLLFSRSCTSLYLVSPLSLSPSFPYILFCLMLRQTGSLDSPISHSLSNILPSIPSS